MGLRINTNVVSLMGQRHLTNATQDLAQSFQRLSSGLRIASAADDAAGLGISERMRAQARSYDALQRNVDAGIGVAQTTEAVLGEVSGILVRLRELAVQAANGTLSDEDRQTLNDEFQMMRLEIDRMAQATTYNGIHLTNGSVANFVLQVGTEAGDDFVLDTKSIRTSDLAIHSIQIDRQAPAQGGLAYLDAAIDQISLYRGEVGIDISRLETMARSFTKQSEGLKGAESRIRDVDVASEMANLTRSRIIQQAGLSVLTQANLAPELALDLLA